MDRENIIQYIKDFQERSLPELTERGLETPDTDKVVTVYGPRRSGKTFYMFQKMKELVEEGRQKEQILYLNFEDTRLSGIDFKDIEEIVQTHMELFPQETEKNTFIFLDEIQVVDDWEKAVRSLHDRGYRDIYLTGSSATLLSREISTQLRGRTLSYLMLPFSFREFLRHKGFPLENYPDLSSRQEARLKNLLEEYLEWGGFPEVTGEENETVKTQILQEYYEMILYKDLVERHGIQNQKIVKMLLKNLYSSFSAQFSPNNFYNTLKSEGIKVSKKTVYNYTDYLEESLGIFMLEKWHPSSKTRSLSLDKAYLPDTGFGNLYIAFSDKKSQLLENLIFLHLKRRQNTNPQEELYYWRNDSQEEVDFLVKEKDEPKALIQVSYSLENTDIKKRELRGLRKASSDLECENLAVITWDEEDDLEVDGKNVIVQPVWKWMVEPSLNF